MTGKKSIDMTAPVTRVSWIRRDPPPPEKKPVSSADIKEREARNIAIGVVTLALSLFVILIAVSNAAGPSSPKDTIHIRMSS